MVAYSRFSFRLKNLGEKLLQAHLSRPCETKCKAKLGPVGLVGLDNDDRCYKPGTLFIIKMILSSFVLASL